VAGYSRLTGTDEEGTHAQLQDHLRSLVDPKIAEHRGRVVKNTGDGMLAEFGSVVDAVRCAVDIQRGMAERNADVPEQKRIEFRIGIHQGDIILDRGDIFGDGVNVAARLEGVAEPGGICVSGRVQEDARGKLDVSFEDAGEQQLKNIARPVRVYRVRFAGGDTQAAIPHRLALPDKPSIAVLPFQNMSGDPDQEYFADGMVEEIITALSRFRQLVVIARNSSFTYKGRAVDVKQVGRELGVRYVLEGSVRKAGNRVRLTGQLIDASTAAHLWADRFEGALDDIFDLQDRITASVVGAIVPKLDWAEIEPRPGRSRLVINRGRGSAASALGGNSNKYSNRSFRKAEFGNERPQKRGCRRPDGARGASIRDQEKHGAATEGIACTRTANPGLGARRRHVVRSLGPIASVGHPVPAPAVAHRRQGEAHLARPSVECRVDGRRRIVEFGAVDPPRDGVVAGIRPIGLSERS
jgi:TolB-like protein